MKLFLVRHGETVANRDGIVSGIFDSPLTNNGVSQAKMLAKRLKVKKFDVVFCSPLKRTRATAKEIMKYHKDVPFEVVDNLIERNFGVVEGTDYNTVDWKSLPKMTPEGGETVLQLRGRVSRVIHNINKKHKDDSVLIVGHGVLNAAIVAVLVGMPVRKLRNMFSFDNTNLTVVDVKNDMKGKVLIMNCTEHLG